MNRHLRDLARFLKDVIKQRFATLIVFFFEMRTWGKWGLVGLLIQLGFLNQSGFLQAQPKGLGLSLACMCVVGDIGGKVKDTANSKRLQGSPKSG